MSKCPWTSNRLPSVLSVQASRHTHPPVAVLLDNNQVQFHVSHDHLIDTASSINTVTRSQHDGNL